MANLNEKIIDKINKLLAMGNDSGASETERETALRQAHSLLAKHNLQMVDLKAKDDRGQLAVLAKKHSWAKFTAMAIAELFFCEYLVGSSNANYAYHIFVGREDNAKVAIALYMYCVKSMMKQARLHKQRSFSDQPYKAEMDFLKGAARAIQENANKLKEAKQAEMNAENGTGTSLVLADYYKQEQEANKKWTDENMQVKEKMIRSKASRTEDFVAGAIYGASVNLGTGIEDKSKAHAEIA